MVTLHIDLETYSSIELSKAGLYKYTQAPDFEILLFAYAYNDDNVQIIDLTNNERAPEQIIRDLADPAVIKMAHNAAFEWRCLQQYFGLDLPITQWRCSMIHALYCGYPASLDEAGKALGLPVDKQKISTGKALIRKFCKPCKATQSNSGRTRNLPRHEPEQWELFKAYCLQDVVAEREIERQLAKYPVPDDEWRNWHIDMTINSRGIAVDQELIAGALQIGNVSAQELIGRMADLTGLDNPNSVTQLKGWLASKGVPSDTLNKEAVTDILAKCNDDTVTQVLRLRQEAAKSSLAKYDTMAAAVCDDGRIRGLLQFYGANRTGRWAGRLVQVQNLPRNYLKTLDIARRLAKTANIEALRMLYGNIPDTLSQLIRTAFVPREGCYYVVADYSAIEARVIAWLAGEQWVLDVFRGHGKIYEATASQMFGVPLELITKDNPEYELRQKGKVATLALGYQGAIGALIQMGALRTGLTEEELPDIVHRWRAANPRIVELWRMVEDVALSCVVNGYANTLPNGIRISRDDSNMIITLPSGRQLFYSSPTVIQGDRGRKQITYMGLNQLTKKWEHIPTYGGKLVENITQAVARDCLAYAIQGLTDAGYHIVMHVHDEVVMEVQLGDPKRGLAQAIEIMCRVPPWAQGLPLNAAGFTCKYYQKD